MMIKSLFLSTLGLLPAVKGSSQPAPATSSRPNIVLFLVDDLGWADVGFMGSNYYETPNLDKLSKQGMVFTNAYAACSVCSPTRASIMTGKYPARTGITDWIRARFQLKSAEVKSPPPYEENAGRILRTPSNPFWMELSEVTLAEVLKKAGYFTCHIGKWHLGPDDYYPEKQGFDLNIAGNDMGQPVNYFDPYADKNGITFPNLKPRKEGEYLTDRLADELKGVIESHRDKPFFINMCTYAVHTPLMAKKEMVEKYRAKAPVGGQKNPVYAAMVESMDQNVGLMMKALEDNGLIDNTIIIFFSDNGGLIGPTDNTPLRSGKGYAYEGGIRIPMAVYWKDRIKAGSVSNLPVSTVDILPTLCAITQTSLPETTMDGRDISPALYGKPIRTVPLYWHFPHYREPNIVPYSIIRDGKWKLIKNYEGETFELYNLEDDLSEKTNLAAEKPELVKSLNGQLEQWLKETNAKVPVVKNPGIPF